MYMPVGDLAPDEAKTIVYYYGVGFGTDLDAIMQALFLDANPPRPDYNIDIDIDLDHYLDRADQTEQSGLPDTL